MKYLSVALLFVFALLVRPTTEPSWLVRLLVVAWAIWLQRKILTLRR